MPLEAPNLDDRSFDKLKQDLQRRIPRYAPEWTDWNESDPGTTLIELFAWLAESIGYRLNQVPELSYVKFLQLLGLQLEPARPAIAHLSFEARPGADLATLIVPRGTQVTAAAQDGGTPIVFETEVELGLVRLPLADIQVLDGAGFSRITDNVPSGTTFRPLGWVPQVGNALYLGFGPPDPALTVTPFPREIRLRVSLRPAGSTTPAATAGQVPPPPPVELEWEYLRSRLPGADEESPPIDRWGRLGLFDDQTGAFSREGYVLIEGPADAVPVPRLGKVNEPRLWLRARVTDGRYPVGQEPEIDVIRPNTVPAVSLVTIVGEALEDGDGRPDQERVLRNLPVLPESLVLTVTGPDGTTEVWERRDDFLGSKAEDRHFTFDPASGRLRFGDGRRGLIPVTGAQITASYRAGGGERANVAARAISQLQFPVPGVASVTNEYPAVGGQDEQHLDELKQLAPQYLRARNRAVTSEDFAALAVRVGGVARATAVPLAHPEHPGVQVPGAVSVVIVPDNADRPPRPSRALLEAVAGELDRHRLVTTELYVKEPVYHEIRVAAVVEAERYASFDQVTKDVEDAIDALLAPLSAKSTGAGKRMAERGGGQSQQPGRPFGQDLYPTTLYRVIQEVAGVVAIRSLSIDVDNRPHNSGGLDPVPLGPDELVYAAPPGQHNIQVVATADERNGR